MLVPSQFAPRAVAIGASAGAIEALSQILPALPGDYPLPVFVVVHVPANGRSLLSELFASRCHVAVREAEDKMPIAPACVYFAPPDYHMLIENERELSLSIDPPVRFSRPSIDLMFESVADVFGSGALGIVLSGSNDDGARGLQAVARAGGVTVVQSAESARSEVMPLAARERAPRSPQLAPNAIAELLVALGGRRWSR